VSNISEGVRERERERDEEERKVNNASMSELIFLGRNLGLLTRSEVSVHSLLFRFLLHCFFTAFFTAFFLFRCPHSAFHFLGPF
jgi:hypothetical protein